MPDNLNFSQSSLNSWEAHYYNCSSFVIFQKNRLYIEIVVIMRNVGFVYRIEHIFAGN